MKTWEKSVPCKGNSKNGGTRLLCSGTAKRQMGLDVSKHGVEVQPGLGHFTQEVRYEIELAYQAKQMGRA